MSEQDLWRELCEDNIKTAIDIRAEIDRLQYEWETDVKHRTLWMGDD